MEITKIIAILLTMITYGCKQVDGGAGAVSNSVSDLDKGKGEVYKTAGDAGTSEEIPIPISIDLLPKKLILAEGMSASMTAIGKYPYHSSDVTQYVEWVSSSPSLLTFDDVRNNNVASTHGVGTVLITATMGSVSAEVEVSIIESEIKNLMIDVESSTIPLDANFAGGFFAKTVTFKAIGVLTNQLINDFTSLSECKTDKTDVAEIKAGNWGTFVAKKPGKVIFRCTYLDKVAELEMTFEKAKVRLVDFEISETFVALPMGLSKDLTVIGIFSSGERLDITPKTKFVSKDPSIAGFVNAASPGTVRSTGFGSTLISVSSEEVSKEIPFATTDAVLTKIEVTPKNITQPLGVNTQFTAGGTFSDGTILNLTSSVVWASTETPIATINNNSGSSGLTSSTLKGTTKISATFRGLRDETGLTISDAALLSINVFPASFTIAKGQNVALTATGVYSDKTFVDLTYTAKWTSTNTSVASVSDSNLTKGLVKGENTSIGATYIRATLSGILGQSSATVTAAQVVSLAVTALNPSVALGRTKQFAATATYTDGSSADVTKLAKWTFDITSAGYNYAGYVSDVYETKGLASSIAEGKIRVLGTFAGFTTGLDLVVTPKVIIFTTVQSPVTGAQLVGGFHQFTVVATFTDGTTIDVTTANGPDLFMSWSATFTSPETVVSVNNAGQKGLVSTLAPGGATINTSLTTPGWGTFNRTGSITVKFDCSTIGGVLNNNFCIFLGAPSASCDSVCSNAGGLYHSSTGYYYGKAGLLLNCNSGLVALSVPGSAATDDAGAAAGVGCGVQAIPGFGSINGRATLVNTNALDTITDFSRVCSCEP